MLMRLKKISIRGFKSIRELEGFEPRNLTVLIGPNGAGKTNLVSFFRFIGWMLSPPGNLQAHVAKLGGANAVLHDGVARTPQCEGRLEFESEKGVNEYRFRFFHAAGDTLVFAEEAYRFSANEVAAEAPWTDLGSGHRESRLITEAEGGDRTARYILSVLRRFVVYQFHNTSDTARMKMKQPLSDNKFLKEDGANIAPILLRLRDQEPRYYARILESIRLVLPFFADFDLEPDYQNLLLKWTERDCDLVLTADQASDGMLRVIQIWTLLLLPSGWFPALLILDEPELGLHPTAIVQLCGMLKSAAQHCQIIIATQSTRLVDEIDPGDVVVVDRLGRESTFTQKNAAELDEWLQDYTLSELWEKNILGGKPR